VIKSLVESKIEMIEVGFLEDSKYSPDSTYFNEIVDVESVIASTKRGTSELGVMLRTDRCGFGKLVSSELVDFVRIAFYREHMPQVKQYTHKLKELGYKVYLNPIAITTYTSEEARRMLNELNSIEPNGVSIVDTFGALTRGIFDEILEVFDSSLHNSVTLGIHLHENLSSSLQLSTSAITYGSHDKIIDSSINGMGRIPGNLPSELIAGFLNQHHGKDYDVGKIIAAGYEYIKSFRQIHTWGYNSLYMHSAILNIDRSFPEYFEEQGYSVIQNLELQRMIKEADLGNHFDEGNANDIIARKSAEYE
jgi:4-hydroxy 2-oxovalerate aldolase